MPDSLSIKRRMYKSFSCDKKNTMKKKIVFYRMESAARDPRGTGDTRSWFFYYKWRAGSTWVAAPPGYADADVGDLLYFIMDDQLIGAADITAMAPSNSQGERELHYDSDKISIPTTTVLADDWQESPTYCVEGEEPQWLKKLMTA